MSTRPSEPTAVEPGTARLRLPDSSFASTIRKTFPEEKKPNQRDDVSLLVTGISNLGEDEKGASFTVVPRAQLPHCSLFARVWMLYELREIESGRKYYEEGRQRVKISRDATKPADVAIMNADDVAPVWYIRIVHNQKSNAATTRDSVETEDRNLSQQPGNGEKTEKPTDGSGSQSGQAIDPASCEALRDKAEMPGNRGLMPGNRALLKSALKQSDAQFRNLVFTDYDQASKFAGWVRRNEGASLSNRCFNYPEGASLVPVRITEDECTAGAEVK
jgi:hypothetical protein